MHNNNQHAYYCLPAVLELVSSETTYKSLRNAWREGATAILKKGMDQRDKLRMTNPLDKAYVQGIFAAQSARQKGRDMAARFAYHLNIPDQELAPIVPA
jgi:hypothetical protein